MTVMAGAVLLYGRNNCTDLNELRCEKATLDNIAAKRLPPTDDSFQLRLLIEIPGPVKYGHERGPESHKYHPKLISQTTAAPELLNNLVYSCALNKCDGQCTCAINEQPCTAACTCEASLPTGEDDDDDDDDDDENVDGNVYVHAFFTNRVTLSVFCFDLILIWFNGTSAHMGHFSA